MSAGTRDLPQANSLARVRELVAAVADGRDESLVEAGEAVGLSPRHARYYGGAASVTLPFLVVERDRVGVTPLGRDLLATAPRSHAERMIFRRAIVESPSVVSIAHDLLDPEGPTAQALTQRLIHAGLSPATAARRASTLLSWRRYVLERQMSLELARAGERGRARGASGLRGRSRPRG